MPLVRVARGSGAQTLREDRCAQKMALNECTTLSLSKTDCPKHRASPGESSLINLFLLELDEQNFKRD